MRKLLSRALVSDPPGNPGGRHRDQAATIVCTALAMATLMLMSRIAGVW